MLMMRLRLLPLFGEGLWHGGLLLAVGVDVASRQRAGRKKEEKEKSSGLRGGHEVKVKPPYRVCDGRKRSQKSKENLFVWSFKSINKK